jgi:protein-L-isoaspartate(D-aspartate) O-methyltransferase
MDLALRRRFFAEEIEAVGKLRSAALVDALATVPRERYLPPGPWTVLADADMAAGGPPKTRQTADADPARVYHNITVAIDPERQLFNGQPSMLAGWIDVLDLARGGRVMHLGCGLGYYTALMGRVVGETGRVVALEADPALAERAQANLIAMPWVDVRAADGRDVGGETFDAILINAGVTHPLPSWLDALAPGGRMILPLTAAIGAMGNISKGPAILITHETSGDFSARLAGFVAIYSAVGIRDARLNERLGQAMMGGPQKFAALSRLRRDAHEPSSSCWLHDAAFCLSS